MGHPLKYKLTVQADTYTHTCTYTYTHTHKKPPHKQKNKDNKIEDIQVRNQQMGRPKHTAFPILRNKIVGIHCI